MVLAHLCHQGSDLPAESRTHVSENDFIFAQATGIRLQRILEVLFKVKDGHMLVHRAACSALCEAMPSFGTQEHAGRRLPVQRPWLPVSPEKLLSLVPDESGVPILPVPAPENNLCQDMAPLQWTSMHFALSSKTSHVTMVRSSSRS